MRRRTSTTPIKIYSYGCLAAIDGGDHVEEQLRRAHKYRNGLVEIEHRRRNGIAEVQRAHDTLGPLLDQIHMVETQIAMARIDARVSRSGTGADVSGLRELIEACAADLAVLRWLRAWHKTTLRSDGSLKTAYSEVTDKAQSDIRALRGGKTRDRRGEVIAPPFWGTYLVVEKAAEAWRKAFDRPKFLRYSGEGRIAVQLQGGLTVAEAMSGEDTRLRILPAPQMAAPVNPTSRRQIARSIAYGIVSFCRAGHMEARESYRIVKIRIGSDGRAPVWATFPILEHRPLPADGKITWAWIVRRRHGVRYRYHLQLTMEAASYAPPQRSDTGVVAIDIGCREQAGEVQRVAAWLDADGNRGDLVPQTHRLSARKSGGVGRRRRVPDDLEKSESLRSIRDKNLDEEKDALALYRHSLRDRDPGDLCKRLRHLWKWRSPARLGALYRDWQRHDGDEAIYARLGVYLRQDRHLLDWESHERERHHAARRSRYRTWAVAMVKRYRTIIVANRDYTKCEPAPEADVSTTGHVSRVLQRSAAPGELREEIRRAAKSHGATIIEIAIAGDALQAVDGHVCELLLASASTGVMRVAAPPLAAHNPAESRHKPKTPRPRRLGTREKIDPLANHDVSPRVVRG